MISSLSISGSEEFIFVRDRNVGLKIIEEHDLGRSAKESNSLYLKIVLCKNHSEYGGDTRNPAGTGETISPPKYPSNPI